MLTGQMMHRPLLVSSIIDYAASMHPDAEIVSSTVEGGLHRASYPAMRRRIAQLAHGLRAMGVKPGDRVATLAWNGYRHFELYYAIAGIGAVCHTINPRLSAEQFTYIVNHAGDRVLFFDTTFTGLLEGLAPNFPGELRYVAMADRAPETSLPDCAAYEDLLAGQPEDIDWEDFPEDTACALCYTSGTTGDPKGVLYSNRAMVLHSLFVSFAARRTFFPGSRILPIVPLFHANAWGLPYVAPLTGCSLIFPGPHLDGPSVFDLLDSENVNSSWGVPTVWLGLLGEMAARGRKPAALEEVLIGGSAAPRSMIETFMKDYDIRAGHGWGMTEMSPVGTLTMMTPEMEARPIDERIDMITRQGRRMYGVDLKITDDDGAPLPHDGVAEGNLHVRGNGIVSGYFNNEAASRAAIDPEGWFITGDVARIDPDNFLTITDRAKDLIKSGGEWISSIDVENTALAHPGVANCAVIAVAHPKWDERPLLVVQKAPGAEPGVDELRAHVGQHLAKWQVPDDVVFVDELPLTATGKVAKRLLRDQFANHPMPNAPK